MKLYLVRHARAVPRDAWTGDDLLRPLSERGLREAEALAAHLADDPPHRLLCAPSVRCQQTVEPLAVARSLAVEVDERLAESDDVGAVLELLPDDGAPPVLFCTHADVVAGLLRVFELAEPERGGRIPCKKGSVWVLEGGGYTPSRATYFEPVRRTRRERGLRYAARDEVERPRTVRAAVLDLGSTSFTLLIADVGEHGDIRPVVGEKVMLRLGAVIATDRRIPADVAERAVAVAQQLHAVAEQEKVQVFLPVATAAVRDAANGRALAGAISEAVGQPVRILSGEEEARLMFRAFQQRLDLGDSPVLGLDLGGGSLELAVGTAGGVEAETTLPLGAVRLHGQLVKHDPMTDAEAEAIRRRVREKLAPHRERLRATGYRHAVATGGTVRALGRLVAERQPPRKARREGPLELDGATFRSLHDLLLRSSHRERLAMRGVRRRRADLLPVAAVILASLADELGFEGFTLSDWGLRQGVLLAATGADGRD